MKAVYGLWADIKVSQLNRLLRPFDVRLVVKTSRDWGAAVTVTAHAITPADASGYAAGSSGEPAHE